MSTRARPSCLAVNRQFKRQTDLIRIADNILTDGLDRFTGSGCSRRHGSSVPGPLEVRKRATMRRMVNLAHVGCRGAIDPGLLLGQGSKRWPWHTPAATTVQDAAQQAEDCRHQLWRLMKELLI